MGSKLNSSSLLIFRRLERRDAERRIRLLNDENNILLKRKKEKEEFCQKMRYPSYLKDPDPCRISQEEIETKFRNYEMKEA